MEDYKEKIYEMLHHSTYTIFHPDTPFYKLRDEIFSYLDEMEGMLLEIEQIINLDITDKHKIIRIKKLINDRKYYESSS